MTSPRQGTCKTRQLLTATLAGAFVAAPALKLPAQYAVPERYCTGGSNLLAQGSRHNECMWH